MSVAPAAGEYVLTSVLCLPALCPLQLGTMWGILPKEEAEHIVPEGHRRPHFDDEAAAASSAGASSAAASSAAAGASGDVDDGQLSFDDTPEDHSDGRVAPLAQAGGQQRTDATAAAAATGAGASKGEAQAVLRMRRFGGARQQA